MRAFLILSLMTLLVGCSASDNEIVVPATFEEILQAAVVINGGLGKKKNAADFEMTIRMGEDVASRKFDAFCIVADDTDYITAAERLHARGKRVYGIGLGKAPLSYRKVLNGYFDLGASADAEKEIAPSLAKRKAVENPKGDLDG